nr:C2 family cysteine protease [Rhodoblastus sphagnicola]
MIGNLSATSTAAQTTALVSKWFQGTDNPSLGSADATYQTVSGSLFASGGPSASDINQGALRDSAFLASLSSLAATNPSAIQSMFQDNGNGTVGVRFYLNGKEQWVTVDKQLAVMNSGTQNNGSNLLYDSSTNGSLWGQLAEKAFAEFTSELNYGNNAMYNIASDGNSYFASGLNTTLGDFSQLSLQDSSTTHYNLTSDISANAHYSAMKTWLGNQITAALSSGNTVTMQSTSGSTGEIFSSNLVSNHSFAVVGYNATTQKVTLDNPWNANGVNITTQFSMTLDELAAEGVRFNVNGGAVMTA